MYPVGYNGVGVKIEQTGEFGDWFEKLGDVRARARIDIRIRRLSLGNFGDTRYVGDKVLELRIHYGPGYRVYFCRKGPNSIVIVLGGTKNTQQRDIGRARAMARELLKPE